MAYSGAYKEDRAKALVGVAAVHVVLAAVILTGLNVRNVQHVVDSLKTFDIKEIVPPPPPPPPPPQPQAKRAKEEEGAAGKKANPTPVVAPKPKIVVPATPPIVAAPVAGTGSATTSGAANYGTGTGAGGSGSGRGGGGNDFSGYTPAQRISKIPDREYRRIAAASGRSSGRIGLTLKVNTDGRPSNCRISRTSGDGTVDSLMCQLAVSYVRFRPARDDRGNAVAQDITWYPDWSPR
jgi:periplasmic protein TonB